MQQERHEDVYFIDARRGWVVNRNGEIHKTTDGGASWRGLPGDPSLFFRSVAFADSLRGWVGTLFATHPLYATMDGGATLVAVDNIPAPVPAGICGLWIVNGNTIYGCGTFNGPARLVKSLDGGASWDTVDMSPWASTLVDCYFVSPDSGFVVGGRGSFPTQTQAVVLWTGNGGATWETRYLGDSFDQWGWKISFPSPRIGYVSLESSSRLPIFVKTSDGGAHWNEGTFVEERQQGIGFATEDLGWIGGSRATTYRTRDGGVSWEPDPFGVAVNSFHMLSPTLGYAVGRGVYKFSVPTPVAPTSVTAVKSLFRGP